MRRLTRKMALRNNRAGKRNNVCGWCEYCIYGRLHKRIKLYTAAISQLKELDKLINQQNND